MTSAVASPSAAALGSVRGRMAMVLDLMPGLTDRQRRVARLMLRNTATAVWTATGELVTWLGVGTIAEAILFSEPGRLDSIERSVKRARARLVEVGLLELVEEGGHGRGSTTRFRFSLTLMEAVERSARQAGVLQRFGGGEGGDAVTLAPTAQGDSPVRVTPAAQGDGGVPLSLPATARGGAQGGVAVPLANGVRPVRGRSGPATGAVPVDNPAAPVDIPTAGAAGRPLRVTGVPCKGDSGAVVGVTPESPEHLNKPDQPSRAPQRRGPSPPAVDRRQREMRLLRPVGGLSGAIDAVERVAKGKRDAEADRRHDTVLQRSKVLLGGDARAAALAVSALDPQAIARLRGGWSPTDAQLRGLLDASLAAARGVGGGGAPAEPAVGAGAEVAALRGDIRALQGQVSGLARLMAALLGTEPGALAAVG